MRIRNKHLKQAHSATKQPTMPYGRRLNHFLPLAPLEQRLLKSCKNSSIEAPHHELPVARNDANTVRAEFLRFLLLGGDDEHPIHERGVELGGAWIQGVLDLESARLLSSLKLLQCHFSHDPIFRDAKIEGSCFIEECILPSMLAERLTVGGALSLHGSRFENSLHLNGAQVGGSLSCENVKVFGEVFLMSARIGSDVDFEGADLRSEAEDALTLDRAVIEGTLRLCKEFTSTGAVRLPGARVGRNIYFGSAKISATGDYAISAENLIVGGDIFFNNGCHIKGMVRLGGLIVKGDFILDKAHFESKDVTLLAEGFTVENLFALSNMLTPLSNASFLHGKVDRLYDQNDSWGSNIRLHGFVYKSFAGSTAVDAKTRLAWLDKQPPMFSGKDKDGSFKPQPWQQLRRVLVESGHFEDARQVGIAYERRLREAGLIGQSPVGRNWLAKTTNWATANLAHKLFGVLIGYGYRPAWLVGWIVAVWLACGALYWYAALQGVMAPSNPIVFQYPAYEQCAKDADGGWYLCQSLPEEYTGFSPLAYSMDVLLPFVDLQQESDWAPRVPTPLSDWRAELGAKSLKHIVRFVLWCEIIFGWVAGVLLVAVVSGLTKRTEE